MGQEDPLEKGMATHSSTLAWKILWATIHGVAEPDTTGPLHFYFLITPHFCKGGEREGSLHEPVASTEISLTSECPSILVPDFKDRRQENRRGGKELSLSAEVKGGLGPAQSPSLSAQESQKGRKQFL